jgi:hypothetical protein
MKLEEAGLDATPLLTLNAQRPPSRCQTARRIAAGMEREHGSDASACRGRAVAANFAFEAFASSNVIARSKIWATSPLGIEWRRRFWTCRSLS